MDYKPVGSLRSAAAIILAAGLSKRMGKPKMLLPWGNATVIEQTVAHVMAAGVGQIIVVTGGFREQIEHQLRPYPVCLVFNPDYENGEMVDSLRCGLVKVSQGPSAIFIVLGDQPDIPPAVFRLLWPNLPVAGGGIIIPSYYQRRGHPWLVARQYWNELIELDSHLTMRDFLKNHEQEIKHINVEYPSILQDLDTPEDYINNKPKN